MSFSQLWAAIGAPGWSPCHTDGQSVQVSKCPGHGSSSLLSLAPAPGSVGEGPLLVLVFPKLDAICHPGPVTLAGSLNTLS